MSLEIRRYGLSIVYTRILHIPQYLSLFASSISLLTSSSSSTSIPIPSPPCDLATLRSLNAIIASFTFLVVAALLQSFHGRKSREDRNLASILAFVLSFTPFVFFYDFLYYTDTGSTFFVMAAILATIKKRDWMSGVCGVVAVLFRQSNIVWVLFCAALTIVRLLEDPEDSVTKGLLKVGEFKSLGMFIHFKVEFVRHVLIRNLCLGWIENLKYTMLALISSTLSHLPYLIRRVSIHLTTFMVFALFVLKNKSLVLGDKSNHVSALHLPQIFYLSVVCAGSCVPYLTKRDLRTWWRMLKGTKGFSMAVVACLVVYYVIENYTYV